MTQATPPLSATAAIGLLLARLGGTQAVNDAAAQTIVAQGWRHHPGWGTLPSKPEVAADFTFTLVEDTVRPRYDLALESDTYLVPSHLEFREVGDGSRGHLEGTDFMFNLTPVDMAIPLWRVATRQRHIDLTSVLRIAKKLADPAADVTLTTDDVEGRPTTILTLHEAGRPAIHILTAETGEPIAFHVVEEHSPRGDTLVEVLFSDYRPADALVLPRHVQIRVGGVLVHDEYRTSIKVHSETDDESRVAAGLNDDTPIVEASLGQMSYALFSTEWVMTYVLSGVRFYFDLQVAPVTDAPVELFPGVKLVVGPSHNTLVVELEESTLAVEAPLYDEYTRAALTQVKEAFPGKPLRTAVGTHFHYDHIGGIREFAADGGLTVIVGEPTVPFFEEIFAGAHTVDPDRFSTRPQSVAIVGVSDEVILDAVNGGEVQIHRIVSDHSDDMLIVYLTHSKSVFNSDLWNPTPSLPPVGAQRGRLATQLYDAIIELGLDVETIIGGHSGVSPTGPVFTAPLAYLKVAAAR